MGGAQGCQIRQGSQASLQRSSQMDLAASGKLRLLGKLAGATLHINDVLYIEFLQKHWSVPLPNIVLCVVPTQYNDTNSKTEDHSAGSGSPTNAQLAWCVFDVFFDSAWALLISASFWERCFMKAVATKQTSHLFFTEWLQVIRIAEVQQI